MTRDCDYCGGADEADLAAPGVLALGGWLTKWAGQIMFSFASKICEFTGIT
jgi:hypothetical protein